MNTDFTAPNSILNLLRELRDETTTLFRQEVTLAKTELKENASRLGGHAARIAIGSFVAFAGAIVLLIGLGHLIRSILTRAGLAPDIAEWIAPTIVGLSVAIAGWLMLSHARKAIAQEGLAPRKAIESLKTSKQWAQRKLSHS